MSRIGLGPSLADLEHQQRVVLEAALTEQFGCLYDDVDPVANRNTLPRFEGALGDSDRFERLLLGSGAGFTDDLCGVRRVERLDPFLGLAIRLPSMTSG